MCGSGNMFEILLWIIKLSFRFVSFFHFLTQNESASPNYHTVCVWYVDLSCWLSSKQITKNKHCKVSTKQGQRLDHTTKIEVSLSQQCRCHYCGDRHESMMWLHQHSSKSLCKDRRCDCMWEWGSWTWRGWGCVSYSVVVRYIQTLCYPRMVNDSREFYHNDTHSILQLDDGKENCGKLKMYCSEFYQCLIHFNSFMGMSSNEKERTHYGRRHIPVT